MWMKADEQSYWFFIAEVNGENWLFFKKHTSYSQSAEAWFRYGVIAIQHRQLHAALKNFKCVLLYGPSNAKAWAILTYMLAWIGKPVAAQVTAQYVLGIRPDLAPIIARAALLLRCHDAPLEMLDMLEGVMHTGFTHPRVIREYVRILSKLGYHAEALVWLDNLWLKKELSSSCPTEILPIDDDMLYKRSNR